MVNRGRRKVVPPTPNRAFFKTRPRIWLDEEGLSVSPDFYVAFSSSVGGGCGLTQVSSGSVSWKGEINNTYALEYAPEYALGYLGNSITAYDDQSDMQSEFQCIEPDDNMEFCW